MFSKFTDLDPAPIDKENLCLGHMHVSAQPL